MKKTTTEIIITILLWMIVLVSYYLNSTLEVRFIFGIVSLVIITTLLGLDKKSIALPSLFFALLLSTFDVIRFSNAFFIFVGIFSIIPFTILIALTFIKRSDLMDLKDKWFDADPEEVEKSQIRKIEIFKKEFSRLPSHELNSKLDNGQIVTEAKTAIQQILVERETENIHS